MRLQQKRAYQAGSTTSKRSNVSWCNAQGKNKGVYDTHDDGMVDNIEKMVKELLHENKIKEDDVEYMINKLTNTIDNNSITGEKFSTVCKRIPSIQTKRQNNDEDDIRY
ncbi:Hypothetical predicted protein [Mytilus galloprovincialis]|uniref:Uncharacterized protein n=1 Tax=Mytilus galloprovincialis TaxID=29158 RepID=A0A8B6GW53_MYTGA|nr:Hypothetical predicted protein [Mytilus galloprovincialis]